MLIKAPGLIQPGTRVDQALGTVDFAPTMMALMNQKADQTAEGRDASPLLRGEDAGDWNDITFLRSAGPRANWLAAVTNRYKLVVSISEVPWLMDHETDPDELHNSIGKPGMETVARRLAKELIQYGEATGDPHVVDVTLRKQLVELMDAESSAAVN